MQAEQPKKYTLDDFINDTNYRFADISSESFRVYEFADKTVRIEEPLALSVSQSGGHRIFDASGVSHYVPSGYRHLYWQVKEGKPHFVK